MVGLVCRQQSNEIHTDPSVDQPHCLPSTWWSRSPLPMNFEKGHNWMYIKCCSYFVRIIQIDTIIIISFFLFRRTWRGKLYVIEFFFFLLFSCRSVDMSFETGKGKIEQLPIFLVTQLIKENLQFERFVSKFLKWKKYVAVNKDETK